ncbi:Crp/Fnr family transcriptional regulator [Sphingomicrobium arenosum]|uniref:Crp/Fnr family transcriptional regulator n=1 Tax=Sphingomicrobium arenosum TaxID=2233861 RepID=UPI00223F13FD|nr:Crp/Fnr family transcriptional regulator [Sphingomicrobium arenosum]
MITELFLKGRLRDAISVDDRAALETAIEDVIEVEGPRRLVSRAEEVEVSYYLVDGYMARYLDDKRGYRQSVGFQVPGDWVDLHSFPMKRLDHDVVPLDRAKVAIFRHDRLRELIDGNPRLTRILWFSTLLDAAMIREWIFRLGRLSAEGRIAHFICELIERMRFIERYDGTFFPVPLKQSDFAEACGVSPVHANRTFKLLRDRGLVAASEGAGGMRILDEDGLRRLGEFRGDYLYGEGDLKLQQPFG